MGDYVFLRVLQAGKSPIQAHAAVTRDRVRDKDVTSSVNLPLCRPPRVPELLVQLLVPLIRSSDASYQFTQMILDCKSSVILDEIFDMVSACTSRSGTGHFSLGDKTGAMVLGRHSVLTGVSKDGEVGWVVTACVAFKAKMLEVTCDFLLSMKLYTSYVCELVSK